MKVSKAIEILIYRSNLTDPLKNPDYEDALKLGIEALKRIREQRKDPECKGFYTLPGETPEDDTT